jgi:hypothetical protein
MNRVAARVENTCFDWVPFVTPRFYLILAAKIFRESRHEPIRQFLVAIELGNPGLCICAFARPHPLEIVRIMHWPMYWPPRPPIKWRVAFRAKHLIAIMDHGIILQHESPVAVRGPAVIGAFPRILHSYFRLFAIRPESAQGPFYVFVCAQIIGDGHFDDFIRIHFAVEKHECMIRADGIGHATIHLRHLVHGIVPFDKSCHFARCAVVAHEQIP